MNTFKYNVSNINTLFVYQALEYYQALGYKLISVPMCVEQDAVKETLPCDKIAKEYLDGLYYVGSAEQSFLQMISDGLLEDGKYCAITPCERSDEIDDSHFNIFLKIELICIDQTNSGRYDYTLPMLDASDIYKDFLGSGDVKEVITSSSSCDLYIGDLEVGSYGNRTYKGINYVYGTGLAEPRFSYAKWRYYNPI